MKPEKKKTLIEFDMKSAPVSLLWTYISTANGLKQWFADDVKIDHKQYTFSWKGSQQEAHLVGMRTGAYIKLRWEEDNPGVFFEMRITVNELTDSTMLSIIDFAEDDEIDELRDLWIYQIDTLKRIIGC